MVVYFSLCCVIYCLCAVFVNAFGIASPELQQYLGTTEMQQGLIITFQSVGGLLSAIFLALYGERFNKIKTVGIGVCALVVSMIAVGLVPSLLPRGSSPGTAYVLVFLLLALGGFGNSTIDLTMNGMVADLFPRKKGLYIPVIHTFYGMGAMAVPFLFMSSVRFWNGAPGFTTPYLLIGVFGLVSFAVYSVISRKITPNSDMTAIRQQACEKPAEVFQNPLAWLLMLIAFLYTAFQYGMSTWLSTYNIQHMAMPAKTSGYVISAYFSVALVMRLMTPRILNRMSADKYYTLFGVLAATVLLGAFLCGSAGMFSLCLILGGFLQGGMVPCFMIIASNTFPNRQSSAASFFLIALSIAGLIIPVLMGIIIEYISFRFAMLGVVLCLLSSAVVLRAVSGKTNTQEV